MLHQLYSIAMIFQPGEKRLIKGLCPLKNEEMQGVWYTVLFCRQFWVPVKSWMVDLKVEYPAGPNFQQPLVESISRSAS